MFRPETAEAGRESALESRANRDNLRAHNLMVAAWFAALCHSSVLLISMINVSTPRFLMMVYPHILLTALFLARAYWPQVINRAPSQ